MPAGTATDAVQAARVMVDAFRLSATQNDAAGILSGILDGLAELVGLDAAGVYIVDAAGRKLRHSLVRGCDMPVHEIKAPFDGQGAIGTVLASGRPVRLAADSPEASAGRGCARSRLLVPILGSTGGVLGALDVWSDDPEGYDSEAANLLTTYGLAVAGAIEGARLQAEMVDKRRMDVDLALARQVMQGLLPNNTPDLPGFDIAGSHATSLTVGGDYFEFIPLGDDRWGVVIADVVGKGITAALLVSAIRASIASLVGHELAVRAIMRRANRFFHESVEEGKYVTLFYAVLDIRHRRLLYSNAGHVPPVLLRKGGGVELLEDGGVPLGLFEAPRYVDGYATLREGDLLALYTDGVVEAMDRDDQPYGLDRFVATLARARDAGACEICSAVMRDVRQHLSGGPSDDCSLVVIKTN
ncbi:MAG: SpoIIE family protein phosphatase [Acidobacteria bacterium]|nr:SpoIIE family protein phosphatase [Acidobacteriota bacterium]